MNDEKPGARLHLDPEELQRLGRLDLISRVIANALRQGTRRSRLHGFSSEFSDHKPYAIGDDLRFLDWRIYARTDRLLVRKFDAETSFESLLLLDASKSMAWRWKTAISKLEYGTNLLAAIAYLHIENQDAVGLLVHDASDLHHLPVRSSSSQLLRIFRTLGAVRPGSANTLCTLVQAVALLKRHRGQVVVCSDLEEDQDQIGRALETLAAGQDEVVVLHLLDIHEVEIPFQGATALEDSETGEVLPLAWEDLRALHRRNLEEFTEGWRHRCQEHGIRYHAIHTGMSYVEVLMDLAV